MGISSVFKRLSEALFSSDNRATDSPTVLAGVPSYSAATVRHETPRSPSTSDQLINASRDGDIGAVSRILSSGFHPKSAIRYFGYSGAEKGAMVFHSGDGIYCMTPVQAAVVGGHNNVLQALITAGAGVSSDSITKAAADGNIDALKLMVGPYLKDRPSWQHPERTLSDGLVSACYGGHRDVANFLLDNGALVDGYNGNPLSVAMSGTNLDLVKDLVSRGANVNGQGVKLCEGYRDVNKDAVAFVQEARRTQFPEDLRPDQAEITATAVRRALLLAQRQAASDDADDPRSRMDRATSLARRVIAARGDADSTHETLLRKDWGGKEKSPETKPPELRPFPKRDRDRGFER